MNSELKIINKNQSSLATVKGYLTIRLHDERQKKMSNILSFFSWFKKIFYVFSVYSVVKTGGTQ